MAIFGYCRISTAKQNIERQVRNITSAYPTAVILQEAYSGTRFDRPQWAKLVKTVRAGDVIVFDSVSRMSRNADDGFRAYEQFYNAGVGLVFLKEPHINTETYRQTLSNTVQMTGDEKVNFILEGVNKYLMALAKEQIRLAFEQSEKEVEDLHQRTREGIQTARLNGKQIGGVYGRKLNVKKAIHAKEVIAKHSKDFGGTLADPDTIKLAGVSRNSYYKYKRELRDAAACKD